MFQRDTPSRHIARTATQYKIAIGMHVIARKPNRTGSDTDTHAKMKFGKTGTIGTIKAQL